MTRHLPPLGAAQRIVLFVGVGIALGVGAGVASTVVHAAEPPAVVPPTPVVARATPPTARPTTTTAKSVTKANGKRR
jgi:predicted phosphoribosyltransferase